jgi:ABC-2 type transport system ATP-binding protein
MILGLLHPTSGSLQVLDHTPRHVRTKARMGFLPEESYLYPCLTSEETLIFYGRLFALPPTIRKQRTGELLDMMGLQDARKRLVGEFSKGMARRIGLAQALINDPDLIVLDEPTSGLDPIGCRQVKDLIQTLANRGKTVLLSSHLLADVEDVCDRIAILYNGEIQAAGSMHDLLEVKEQRQLVLPELPPEQLRQVLQAVKEIVGSDVVAEYPKRDLEQFFLDVVTKAQGRHVSATGAQPEQRVATYLKPNPPGH